MKLPLLDIQFWTEHNNELIITSIFSSGIVRASPSPGVGHPLQFNTSHHVSDTHPLSCRAVGIVSSGGPSPADVLVQCKAPGSGLVGMEWEDWGHKGGQGWQ